MNETFNKLNTLGYTGDNNLSNIIDWIRVKYNFYIYVEHGTLTKNGKTFDLTTDFGCHRGNYSSYTKTQEAGILKFLSYLENGHIKEIIKEVEEQPIVEVFVDEKKNLINIIGTSLLFIGLFFISLYLSYFKDLDIFLIFFIIFCVLYKTE